MTKPAPVPSGAITHQAVPPNMTVLTVTDLLQSTDIGSCLHRWRTEGGAITITRDKLRQALEDAYDPTMPNWPAMVEIDDA